MIVLVANRWNTAAEELVERWGADAAGLLTPADLSVRGWVQHLADASTGTAVVSGRRVLQGEITAVIPLMPCIFEEELTTIVPEDRAYVAAEMTAFLFSWLTRMPCRVLNRPTPPCLSGPFWRPERWVHLAAQCGIPVQPFRRVAAPMLSASVLPLEGLHSMAAVTVIGEATFGEADPTLARRALVLARSAGVDLLEVHFSGLEADALFLSAQTIPRPVNAWACGRIVDCIALGGGADEAVHFALWSRRRSTALRCSPGAR